MSETKLSELGIMIDCSRNAVVNLPALKDFTKLCAKLGYDFIGLYTEDTIELPGEPYFGYQRGRYSADEIREADAYARSLGMELRPYIQTLAHINQIVDYEAYADIIDINDILLIGDPKTEALIDKLLKTISEVYSTKKVNIGMDEAHMVGLGKYLEKHGFCDRVEIMLTHLNKVVELCKKHGLQPQMWSDMFFRLLNAGAYGEEDANAAKALSESLANKVKIPDGLELVYWDYYSTKSEHYESIIAQHKAFAPKLSFAGGAWKWMGFAPYNSYSLLITRAAMKAACSSGIDSFVMTMWGDDGDECSMYAALPVLFEAALLAGKLPKSELEKDELFRKITGYTIEDFMLLDLANPGCSGEHKNNLSKILLFNDPLLGVYDSLVPKDASKYYREASDKLADATKNSSQESADKEAVAPGKFDSIFRTQELLCRVLEHKADLGCRIRKAYKDSDKETLKNIADNEIPELLIILDSFYEAFRKQWMAESKSFGFEVQTVRIGGLRQRLSDIKRIITDYLSGELSCIEELETKAIPCGYRLHGESVDYPEYNVYQKLVTTSRLSW